MPQIAIDLISRYAWYGVGLVLGVLGIGVPCHQLTAQRPLPVHIMHNIKAFRVNALADTTPINYCNSSFFWSATGELVDDGTQRPRPRVLTRDECAAIREDGRYFTRIDTVKLFTDSIVVEGATMKGGVGYGEAYTFSRNRLGFFGLREFRIVNVVNFDGPPITDSVRPASGPLVILNGQLLPGARQDSVLASLRNVVIDSIRVYPAGAEAERVFGSRGAGGVIILGTRARP